MQYLKQPRIEHPYLLEMARIVTRPCLLAVPGYCISGPFNVDREVWCCACHGNGAEWNKGGQMKAHDFFSVWGCSRCHLWLDQSNMASGEQRDRAFRIALARQIIEWDKIASNRLARPRDHDAARWAIDHLADRGYVSYGVGYAKRSIHPEGFFKPYMPRILPDAQE